ncbi:MAG TPA: hypothetical protein VF062_15450, partial [Candidatus Limnocylindrales bacterium]
GTSATCSSGPTRAAAVPDTIDVEALPPTQWLLLEALAARTQLGAPFWTVRRERLGPAIRGLEDAGLIGTQPVTDHHVRVWLTDAGRAIHDQQPDPQT